MKTAYIRSTMTGLLLAIQLLSLSACQTPIGVPTSAEAAPTVSTPTASTAMPPAKPQPITFVFLPKQIDESFVQGTVNVSVKGNVLQNWLSNRLPVPNLGELKTAGATPRLMAFGDGFVAGWRDGGYFLEGQRTAFPNLIAWQMGISDFKSPLFDEAHGNGTGYLILNPMATGPRWKEVTNNKAILSLGLPPELVPFQSGELHNLGTPKLSNEGGILSPPPPAKGWVYEGGAGFTQALPFFWRMFPAVDRYKISYIDVRRSYQQERVYVQMQVSVSGLHSD